MRADGKRFGSVAFKLIVFIVLLVGCAPKEPYVLDDSLKNISSLKVAVLPFLPIFPEDLTRGAVESPLTGAIFDAARPSGAPESELEKEFLQHLDKMRPGVTCISGEETSLVFRRISSSSLKSSLRQALCETGRELGADTVIVGYLYRFRELRGESFSAERPASVAFEIVMLTTGDGRVVWRGIFDHSQKSLMENIFQLSSFYKGHGRWMTARKLASQGLEEVMKTFPQVHPK